LFADAAKALFVYEPATGGLYQPRQLLFRFPKDAWVYDIAIRGDDLYVSTHTAIYLLEGAGQEAHGIVANRLVWGLPMMKGWDMHQGIHAWQSDRKETSIFPTATKSLTMAPSSGRSLVTLDLFPWDKEHPSDRLWWCLSDQSGRTRI
jgi:hypothetical protein